MSQKISDVVKAGVVTGEDVKNSLLFAKLTNLLYLRLMSLTLIRLTQY